MAVDNQVVAFIAGETLGGSITSPIVDAFTSALSLVFVGANRGNAPPNFVSVGWSPFHPTGALDYSIAIDGGAVYLLINPQL